ncbi:hypothetical protein LCER1_G008990, partial [Lachnellula cervina]
MGASNEAVAILKHDMITEHGFVHGMFKSTHPTMNGPALDVLNAKTVEVFDKALRQFATPTKVNLFEWIGKQIMRATTDAIYGPFNPMREDQNIEAWSKYHPALMIRLHPKIHTDCIEQKIPDDDIPKFLVGTVFNNVANTVPTAFWVLYHIFSDAIVLQECRNEVSQAVLSQDGTSTIDLTIVLNSCPILLSTYQEIFRHHGMANSVRVVAEDHMLDNRYLLKKGGLVMISARAQHSNPA